MHCVKHFEEDVPPPKRYDGAKYFGHCAPVVNSNRGKLTDVNTNKVGEV